MKIATAKQMQEIDRKTIEQTKIPGLILMENAAIAVTKACMKQIKNKKQYKILVICGPGNNGGDGLAIARHLHQKKIKTSILLIGDENKITGDAKINYDITKALAIPIITLKNNEKTSVIIKEEITQSNIIIDACFGTGLKRELAPTIKEIIEHTNKSQSYVIAVDVPTGIQADTGAIMGSCINANKTITFALIKKGLLLYPAATHVGKIEIADIGIPEEIINTEEIKTHTLTKKEAKKILPTREERSNKGSFGNILVIAGSQLMPGASYLAGSACYKTGAGKVNICAPKEVIKTIQNKLPQAITTILPETNGKINENSISTIEVLLENATVIIVGPGIGTGEQITNFMEKLLPKIKIPIIIDADGLNAIAQNTKILKKLKAPSIITPHPKEMSKLTTKTIEEILKDTITTAANFAEEYNTTVLLKDAHTIIASTQGEIYINTTGNTSLAKAGSGDILTGIIAGLIAQKTPTHNATILGAYIHGKAAEIASKQKGQHGTVAEDILNKIPSAIKKLACFKRS